MSRKTPKTSTSPTGEPGFEVRSPCGRAWFVPLSKVLEDYAAFLKDADKLSDEEARAKAFEDPSFGHTWFCEQFIWQEVERDGTLIKEASPEDILRALNFLRSYDGAGPSTDFTARNVPG